MAASERRGECRRRAGAPSSPATTADAGELSEYVGRYVANFTTFSNEVFTVLEQDGRLVLDIPSQMEFALNAPNDEGLWQFELTDQIAVAFERDDAGDVVGLTLHQAGMAFEVPREGVEVEPDRDQRGDGTHRLRNAQRGERCGTGR